MAKKATMDEATDFPGRAAAALGRWSNDIAIGAGCGKAQVIRLGAALSVMLLDRRIRRLLDELDPKAVEQAQKAVLAIWPDAKVDAARRMVPTEPGGAAVSMYAAVRAVPERDGVFVDPQTCSTLAAETARLAAKDNERVPEWGKTHPVLRVARFLMLEEEQG